MQPPSIDNLAAGLPDEVEESLITDTKLKDRERAARRIRLSIEGVARKLGEPGKVKMFGSFSNGFKTGTSDLDVVFAGEVPAENEVSLLGKFAELLPKVGFENITKIFQASTKLMKFTDMKTQMEVDFCISNELGVRNSMMLGCYCELDERVPKLGRLIKVWAKRHELVGSADGYLNSYAYMLLVIYFLQQTTPPVLPNLQALAAESVPVASSKWGLDEVWETKFLADTKDLEKYQNDLTLSQLLVSFFHFYANFDWQRHAVCMRLSEPGRWVDKFALRTNVTAEQWYVEDPFDLKHNLAGRCSPAGIRRILETMKHAYEVLSTGGPWSLACPVSRSTKYLLKCRVSSGVTPHAFLEQFEDFELVRLHFPKDPGARNAQAFLEFSSGAARRHAHTKNECYVPGSPHQLHLHISTEHALTEAVSSSGQQYSTFAMSAYKMEKQARLHRLESLPAAGMHPQDGGQVPPGMAPPAGLMQQFDPQQHAPPPGQLWQQMQGMPGMMPGSMPMHPAPAVWNPNSMPAVQPAPKAEAPKAQAKPAAAKASVNASKAIVNKAVPRVSAAQLAELADKGVYINLELSQDLLDRRIPILSPENKKRLDSLKTFCSHFKKDAWSSSRREVELTARMVLETPPSLKTPILSPEQYRKLQSLKSDFGKQYKRSIGTAEVG